MGASTKTGNAILNWALRGIVPAPPDWVWVSLHVGDPGNEGGYEVSTAIWPGYSRQDAAGGGSLADAFAAPNAKQSHNLNMLVWPVHDGDDPVVVAFFGLWTAPTGGDFIIGGELLVPKTLNSEDEFVAYPGRLIVPVS